MHWNPTSTVPWTDQGINEWTQKHNRPLVPLTRNRRREPDVFYKIYCKSHYPVNELKTVFCNIVIQFKGGGGGGGVSGHPDYFVKLDFEIAVDQQTRARDRFFEGVLDSG